MIVDESIFLSNIDRTKRIVKDTVGILKQGERCTNIVSDIDICKVCENGWKSFISVYEMNRRKEEIEQKYEKKPKVLKMKLLGLSFDSIASKHVVLEEFLKSEKKEYSNCRDCFFKLLIQYISSLLEVETMKWKIEILKSKIKENIVSVEYIAAERLKKLPFTPIAPISIDGCEDLLLSNESSIQSTYDNDAKSYERLIVLEKEKAKKLLVRLSFLYSILIQKLSAIFVKDQLGESRFFEGFTRVCILICESHFSDKKECLSFIKEEIMQLMRSGKYCDSSKKELESNKLVPLREFHEIQVKKNRVFGIFPKYPYEQVVSPKVRIKACRQKSPLMRVIYPDQISNSGQFLSKFELPGGCVQSMHKREKVGKIKRERAEKLKEAKVVIDEFYKNNKRPKKNRSASAVITPSEVGDVLYNDSSLEVEIQMFEIKKQIEGLENIQKGLRKKLAVGNLIDRNTHKLSCKKPGSRRLSTRYTYNPGVYRHNKVNGRKKRELTAIERITVDLEKKRYEDKNLRYGLEEDKSRILYQRNRNNSVRSKPMFPRISKKRKNFEQNIFE